MGALISAPMSAAATCLGGCGAFLCGKFLESGTVSSSKAAHILLLWLQIFTVVVTLLASSRPESWLSAPCDQLDTIGVCVCKREPDPASCFSSQVAYRVQASAVLLFLFLFLLACSGCAQGAGKSYVVLRFFSIVLFGFAFLFVPNSVFDIFGEVAGTTSSAFLVAQAVQVIKLAYWWNESWYSQSVAARQRRPGSGAAQTLEGMILAASAVLLTASAAVAVVLFVAFGSTVTTAVLVPTLAAMLLLLVVSITSWCEHGALLTSCVMFAYSVWLAVEALAVAPEVGLGRPTWLRVIELVACAATLAALAIGAFTARGASARRMDGDAEAQLGAGDGEAPLQGGAFALHCVVHVVAAMYICAVVAPTESVSMFALRVAALAVSVLLYGWSLVAPKVLTGREF